jgi:hypothetical protein
MIVENEVPDIKKILKYLYNIRMILNLVEVQVLMRKKNHHSLIFIKLLSGLEISHKNLSQVNWKNYGLVQFETKVIRSSRKT